MISDTTYPFLSDLHALRLAFAEQIAVSAAATARRGGPARSTGPRWGTWHEGDGAVSYEAPVTP